MRQITDNRTKAFKSVVKKTPAIVIGLTLLIAGIIVFALHQYSAFKPEPVKETATPNIITVTALGRLEPAGKIIQVSVSTPSQGGRLEELLVEEGDKIRQGQIIAVLDSRDRAEAFLKQAQEQVTVAQAKLAQIKAGAKTGEIEAQQAVIARIEAERSNNIIAWSATVSRLKAELSNAQVEYQRYQQLYNNGAISTSQRDNQELILETAREQLAVAQANLSRIKSAQEQQIAEAKATLDRIAEVRVVDIDVAEAQVRQAQAAVATAQAELDLAYIKSPQAGTVIKILTRPGEVVSSNEGIARIGQIEQMYAIAEVYESDIEKVKIGQKATITSSAISAKLTGTVERIGLEIERQQVVNTDPTANIDAKVVEVKVKLDEKSSQKVTRLTNLLVTVKIDL